MSAPELLVLQQPVSPMLISAFQLPQQKIHFEKLKCMRKQAPTSSLVSNFSRYRTFMGLNVTFRVFSIEWAETATSAFFSSGT